MHDVTMKYGTYNIIFAENNTNTVLVKCYKLDFECSRLFSQIILYLTEYSPTVHFFGLHYVKCL
jgi:hypothetical protein